jgi:hypothetical protein
MGGHSCGSIDDQRSTLEPIAIGRTQGRPRDDYRQPRKRVCNIAGGVISPVLANAYLNRFDQWVENTLIPAHTRGDKRRANPVYAVTNVRAHWLRKHGRHAAARALRAQVKSMPSVDPYDPDYRRLRYVRYADDCVPRKLKEG